ncbi:MAG: HAMP domain-containing histidine kinase [Pseudomonadales bacterium]|nr:HAMP domain-containing histidine kinase [Pseudomonadales bacterium]
MSEPILPSSNTINLRRLNGLRVIVLAAELLVAALALYRWHLSLPVAPMSGLFTAVVVLAVLTALRLRWSRAVTDPELFLHLTLEVVALTVLLYLTGGVANPFAPFYLLPLTLTAVSLPGGYAWAMVAFTMSCYAALSYLHLPLPAVHAGHGGTTVGLHELGMWVGFTFSALLIAGFGVQMGRSVRDRDRMIAALHEQQMQQDHVLALGTLAAGAAHELGTPLSTLAVVLKDVAPGEAMDRDRLELLRAQVARCKQILGSLAATAGGWRAESGAATDLEHWLQSLLARWRGGRPEVRAEVLLDGPRPAPRLVIEQTLEHALLNILNNAADASPQAVRIEALWRDDELVFDVGDRGSGLAPELEGRVGTAGLSTKQEGMGLGLFLTFQTLRRFGGEAMLFDRDGGGTRCRVRLPLAALRITDGH